MPVQQISISLENLPGKFSEVIDYFAEHEINIIALSVVDTADMSHVRIVTNHPEKAFNILKSYGYSIKMTEVLAVEALNQPGGLDTILKLLKEASININYLYTCLRIGEKTVLMVCVDKIDEAKEIFRRSGVHMVGEEIYKR